MDARSRATLGEIRSRVRALGLDQPATGQLLLELAAHVTLLGLGIAGFLLLEPWSLRAIALVLALLGHVGVTTNSHVWAHRAGSRSRRFDDVVAFFSGNFVSGISYLFWRDKHNRRHHGAPNVYREDPDHDFAPFLALTELDLAGRGPLARRWYRWQWLAVPVLLGAMIPRMKAEGVVFAARQLRNPRRRRVALLDLATLALSAAAWWGVPLAVGSLGDALILNVAREAFLSFALFAIFAPAHVPREALFLERRLDEDFVLGQTVTTIDFQVGPLAAFFLSGLQYQLEHHLLPDVCHARLGRVQPIVESACRAHGYPYRVLRWSTALRGALAVLRAPKPVHAPDPAGASAGASGPVLCVPLDADRLLDAATRPTTTLAAQSIENRSPTRP